MKKLIFIVLLYKKKQEGFKTNSNHLNKENIMYFATQNEFSGFEKCIHGLN